MNRINLMAGCTPGTNPKAYSIFVLTAAGREFRWQGPHAKTRRAILDAQLVEWKAWGWEVLMGEERSCWTQVAYGGKFFGWAHGDGSVVRPEGIRGMVEGTAVELAVGFPSILTARHWRASIAAAYAPPAAIAPPQDDPIPAPTKSPPPSEADLSALNLADLF
jgi:hypothetical protein